MIVIESLRSSPGLSGKKRLVVTRQFSIVGEPLREIAQDKYDFIVRHNCSVRRHQIAGRCSWEGKRSHLELGILLGGRESGHWRLCGYAVVITRSERYRPSENSLDLGGVLSLLKTKAVDLLEAEKGAKYRSQFFHLFDPMKMHQLGGYGTLHPAQGRPGVTGEQSKPS